MDEIRAAQEELSKAFSEAGQSFYAAAGQSAPDAGQAWRGGGGAAGRRGVAAKPADDVVEADYEIVDDAKK